MTLDPAPDAEPIVRIDYDGGEVAPIAPRPDAAPPRRSAAALCVSLAALLGLLFWLDRDQTDDAAPVQDLAAEPADDGSLQSDDSTSAEPVGPFREFEPSDVERRPIGDLIDSPVQTDTGWLALRRGPRGSRLVHSEDGLRWSLVDTDMRAGNLFGLGLDDDGTFRTMVNSASLNEQRFILSLAESRDGSIWEPQPGPQHIGSGNLPSQVDIRGRRIVVVGDRPLQLAEPLPVVVDLVDAYVSPAIAEQTCQLVSDRTTTAQRFDLLDCDGEVLGRISDPDQQRTNALATTSFLMQFQQVVTVQDDTGPIDEVVLPAGFQVVSINATESGFLAVVVDSLSGIDTTTGTLGDPAGLVLAWSAETGLLDAGQGLEFEVDLTEWWDNDLEVTAEGDAVFASSSAIYRSEPPFQRWTEVMRAPVGEGREEPILKIGPLGSGLVFRDSEGSIWFGRVDGEWARAPGLEGGVPRDVLVATDQDVVALVQFDSFTFQLIRVPLAGLGVEPLVERQDTALPTHLITSVAPRQIDGDGQLDEWVGVLSGEDRLISSTDGGFTWSRTNLNAGEVVAVGLDADGETTMVMGRNDPDALTLDTWTAISSGWGRNGRWPSIEVGQGEVITVGTGARTVAVIEEEAGLSVAVATPDGEVETVEFELASLPVEVSLDTIRRGDSLVAQGDGSLMLLTPAGVHRSSAPFVEWELLTSGPFEREVPGQQFSLPLFGAGFFANDPRGGNLFWTSCCGEDAVVRDEWFSIVPEGSEFGGVLIATDDVIIFHNAAGDVVAVRPDQESDG